MLNKFARVTILGLITLFFSLSGAESLPSGLCLLANNHGSAHGFIVGNRVYTAAHVLQEGITHIFATRGGRIINVSRLMTAQHRIHNKFADPATLLIGMNSGLGTPEGNKQVKEIAMMPYDVGYIELSESIPSDFILNPSKSISEDMAYQKTLGISKERWRISRFQSNGVMAARGLSLGKDSIPADVETLVLGNDVLPLTVVFDQFAQAIHLSNEDLNRTNVFIDDTIPIFEGNSGLPLYIQLQDGRRLVVGLGAQVRDLLERPRSSKQDHDYIYPTFLTLNELSTSSMDVKSSSVWVNRRNLCWRLFGGH